MTLHDLQNALEANPKRFPRFVLPNGDYIPAHAHVTEVGLVVRSFIDCGGLTGKEEKILLQAHVGDDTDPRLVVNQHGPDPNLSVFLRSDAVAHSPSSDKIVALRLSFSGHSR